MRLQGWLMDAYRADNKVALWVKTRKSNIRVELPFSTSIFMERAGERFLDKHKMTRFLVEKRTHAGSWKSVYEIPVFDISRYEPFISWLEKKTRHRIALYNADIAPEQEFLYKHHLRPGTRIEINKAVFPSSENSETTISSCNISLEVDKKVRRITLDGQEFTGREEDMLKDFVSAFKRLNPDAILMDNAFSQMPLLDDKIRSYGLGPGFHRWDATPIRYRGGRSFFSYGQVVFKDFAIRLRGRFLVDTTSAVGGACDPESIMELCRMTGARFQQIASRSFGSVFQHSLMRLMHEQGYLIPYKEKPVDTPVSMLEMVKGDAGGIRLDPKVGFHRDVAEIDFVSMFPWIIHNKNISAETILSEKLPRENVPGVPVSISLAEKGLVPMAIKPLLDRRMHYKNNPSAINLKRAQGLKYVLITAYGYLRFREFKLGVASSHMAICAYARDILVKAAKLAEQRGFKVLHGIVDSLYLQKKNIQEEEVKEFCKELEQIVGIPVGLEGIFRWVVFLPSINDPHRPLPATYYGVFKDGSIKARGIEVRQRKTPLMIKYFQKNALEVMSCCETKKDMLEIVPVLCRMINDIDIANAEPEDLVHKVRVSKESYRHNLPQKRIVQRLRRRGVKVLPGQFIHYIHQMNKVVLPDEYDGKPDIEHYRRLLERSLFVLLQPFGISREQITEMSGKERQTNIIDFARRIKEVYIPFKPKPARVGLSEKLVKRRLEKDGWTVWRGGLLNVLKKEELYPNIRNKYQKLEKLMQKHHGDKVEHLKYLCHVHHGMPDFICFRHGRFMFVECKLGYETLSEVQKKCISKLQELGFDVEVHRLAEDQTKIRVARKDLSTGAKEVVEKQLCIA